jgi:hypothetical protein
MSTKKAKKVTGLVLKAKLKTDCPTECAICFETPKHKDALITECNHIFCVKCWYTYESTVHINRILACPMCRKRSPSCKIFKTRNFENANPHLYYHHAFIATLPERPGQLQEHPLITEIERQANRRTLQQYRQFRRQYNLPPVEDEQVVVNPEVVYIEPGPPDPSQVIVIDDDDDDDA